MKSIGPRMYDTIAFDADDTLWLNEPLYLRAKDQFVRLLSNHRAPDEIIEELDRRDVEDLHVFGYGIKSFALSMVETAIELSNETISSREIQQIVNLAREMLAAEIPLFDHAEVVLQQLVGAHALMLITKGDTFEQTTKVRRSGLTRYFQHVEVLGEKTPEAYRALLARHQIEAARFLMVGNSLRSDILPVLELGATAVYIPYELTWAHENMTEPPVGRNGYYELEHLGQLPALLKILQEGSDG